MSKYWKWHYEGFECIHTPVPEDPDKCAWAVKDDLFRPRRQCTRNRVEGDYCKQHGRMALGDDWF